MGHPGGVALPSVRVLEMLSEPVTISAGQVDCPLIPGRAVIVPEVIDPHGTDRGPNLGEVGDDVVDELIREGERVGGLARFPGLGLRHLTTLYGLL